MVNQVNRFKWARQNIKHESVKTVSENTRLTRSLIDELETNAGKERGVSYQKIKVLASYYNVSIDWLVGLLPFENWSINGDVRIVEEYTGLSSQTVKRLHFAQENKRKYEQLMLKLQQYTGDRKFKISDQDNFSLYEPEKEIGYGYINDDLEVGYFVDAKKHEAIILSDDEFSIVAQHLFAEDISKTDLEIIDLLLTSDDGLWLCSLLHGYIYGDFANEMYNGAPTGKKTQKLAGVYFKSRTDPNSWSCFPSDIFQYAVLHMITSQIETLRDQSEKTIKQSSSRGNKRNAIRKVKTH